MSLLPTPRVRFEEPEQEPPKKLSRSPSVGSGLCSLTKNVGCLQEQLEAATLVIQQQYGLLTDFRSELATTRLLIEKQQEIIEQQAGILHDIINS
jgi:hypothetical protein